MQVKVTRSAGWWMLLSLLTAAPGWALEGDTKQPMHIEADAAEFNDKTGVSVYRGNVRATQGSMILTGDVVTVDAPRNQIVKVIAEGRPSTFHQTADDGEKIDAEALYMEYSAPDNLLLLLREARVTKADNTIHSERIEYDIVTEVVDAGAPDNGGRVFMTIYPDGKNPQSGPTPAAEPDVDDATDTAPGT